MYGTVARLKVKPGMGEALVEWGVRAHPSGALPSLVTEIVFRQDSDPTEYLLVAVFESRDAYRANAESPEQHARYLEFREFLDADPEWMDGEVLSKIP